MKNQSNQQTQQQPFEITTYQTAANNFYGDSPKNIHSQDTVGNHSEDIEDTDLNEDYKVMEEEDGITRSKFNSIHSKQFVNSQKSQYNFNDGEEKYSHQFDNFRGKFFENTSPRENIQDYGGVPYRPATQIRMREAIPDKSQHSRLSQSRSVGRNRSISSQREMKPLALANKPSIQPQTQLHLGNANNSQYGTRIMNHSHTASNLQLKASEPTSLKDLKKVYKFVVSGSSRSPGSSTYSTNNQFTPYSNNLISNTSNSRQGNNNYNKSSHFNNMLINNLKQQSLLKNAKNYQNQKQIYPQYEGGVGSSSQFGSHTSRPTTTLSFQQQSQHQNQQSKQSFNQDSFNQRNELFQERKRKKIIEMKQQQEISNDKECTFEPDTNLSQKRTQLCSRDFKQFLQDQALSEQKRIDKIRKKQFDQELKLEQVAKARPTINAQSKKIVEKNLQQNQQESQLNNQKKSVHDRLYELKKQHSHFLNAVFGIQDQSKIKGQFNSRSRSPLDHAKNDGSQGRQRSNSNSRDIRLYEDFKQRQKKRQAQIEEHRQSVMKPIVTSKKSEKYFIQKFTKEVVQLWKSLEMDEKHKNNETLDYDIYLEFIANLGFLDLKYLVHYNKQIPEDDIVREMWRSLGGQIKGHITLNNLRVFLLAIMGSHVESDLDKSKQQLIKYEELTYGEFNQHGDLFLESHECPKIQKQFNQLYTNRTHYQALFKEYKRLERDQQSNLNFRPSLNPKSREMADQKRQKVEQAQNTKLTTLDWLSQPQKSPQWREKAKSILNEEEEKQCTFRPNINTKTRNLAVIVQEKQAKTMQELSTAQNSNQLKSQYKNENENTQSKQAGLRQRQSPQSHLGQVQEDRASIQTISKFESLFQDSKNKKYKHKRDKSPDEQEFEKYQQECTFKPKLKSFIEQEKNQLKKEALEFQPVQNPKNIQATKVTIDRMAKARMERESIKQALETGNFSNRKSSQNQFDPASSQMSKAAQNSQFKNSKFINNHQERKSIGQLSDILKSRCNSASAFKSREKSPIPTINNQKLKQGNISKTKQINPEQPQHQAKTSKSKTPQKSVQQQNYKKQVGTLKSKNQIQKVQKDEEIKNIARNSETPLLYVDINIGGNADHNERIIVFQDDSPRGLAEEFAKRNRLDQDTQSKLEDLLRTQIDAVVMKQIRDIQKEVNVHDEQQFNDNSDTDNEEQHLESLQHISQHKSQNSFNTINLD
eukprot:403332451